MFLHRVLYLKVKVQMDPYITSPHGQEYKNMKRLGDSLLNRNTKISQLIANLEAQVHDKPDTFPDKKRATRQGYGS